MPWQQQQLPPGLGFPAPAMTAPAAFPPPQPPGPASSSMLPPSTAPAAGAAQSLPATLPPLLLPALPLPVPLPQTQPLSSEALSKKEARLLAYSRYKEKRKRLNFGKKIRYQTRKALADQRPRVRGQFVRMPKEEAASTGGDNSMGGGEATDAPSMGHPLPLKQQDTAAAAGAAAAAAAAVAGGVSPGATTPASPASTACEEEEEEQCEEPMDQQEEAQEYDRQEEDLGAEEEEPAARLAARRNPAPRPMALDRQLRPRRQYAILLNDESESATMSFGGSGLAHHRQGRVSLHPHQQQAVAAAQAASAAAAAAAAAGAAAALVGSASQPGGASTTGPRGRDLPGAAAAVAATWQQQPHRHLSGHKHRREPSLPAADTSGGGRNGSDSGSNTPGDQTPVPDSPLGERGEEGDVPLQPPTKQQRVGRKQ